MRESWIKLALRRDIVLRSLRVALLVGTVLALINHGDKLLQGSLTSASLLKIVLTYLVPYAVSTWASVQTARAGRS
ncbi:MAG: nitrate/nitrite transporter NrtS [Halieaceae bacterium]